VYTPAERADTLLLFLLYPYMYSVDEKSGGGEDLGSRGEKRREERIIVESS
jgi:hypothetical protein